MMSMPRFREGLVGLLMVTHVGCAARQVNRPVGPVEPEGTAGPWHGVVQVVAGTGAPQVTRVGFTETWRAETVNCSRDTLLHVVQSPVLLYAPVLAPFIPAVCGAMTAALPGMTTRFAARSMRRAAQQRVREWDLSASLRDLVAAGLQASRREVVGPAAVSPVEPGTPGDARDLGVAAVLEITPTEVGIADDQTLRQVSARVRLVRVADGASLADRILTYRPATPSHWSDALDAALAALAADIASTIVPGEAGYRSFPE